MWHFLEKFSNIYVKNDLEAVKRDLELLKTQVSADYASITDLIKNQLDTLSSRVRMREKRDNHGTTEQSDSKDKDSSRQGYKAGQPIEFAD